MELDRTRWNCIDLDGTRWKPPPFLCFNPLNAQLNPICRLLALLGAHHIFHVSRIRVSWSSWIFVICAVLMSLNVAPCVRIIAPFTESLTVCVRGSCLGVLILLCVLLLLVVCVLLSCVCCYSCLVCIVIVVLFVLLLLSCVCCCSCLCVLL